MEIDDKTLLEFLRPQLREHGGHLELDADLWTLFAVPTVEVEANALAAGLLVDAPFAHDAGHSEDDQWTLYYVNTANRAPAVYWLDDLAKLVAGEIRPLRPEHRAQIHEVAGSPAPHRLAQKLVELHSRGELGAGSVREPAVVRALLDRLHNREPLFFSAFLSLLSNHLIDMVVLLRQLISEDVELKNELVMGGLSRDPILQSRQESAAEIRNLLIRFHVINSLDQHKNTAIDNPYAAYLELVHNGEEITASIDGKVVNLPRSSFLGAIHAIRRNLSKGGELAAFDTQAPWMREEIAYSFRFIKQRLASRREIGAMDGLYMLERAVAD